MAEYIERDGAWFDPTSWECVADACKAIKEAPAANVIPIVRCSRREDRRDRQIFIRVYGTELGPRETPVLVVRLKVGSQDHAYQQTLSVTTSQEIANAVERAAQILLDAHNDVAPVVHGRWVPDKNGGIRCSACEKRPMLLVKTNFCPRCGAKMDLEG